MELTTIIAAVTASVSIVTVAFVAYRERRENGARREQRAKAIIELLRVAESVTEPEAVRAFAKSELRRMRADLPPEASARAEAEKLFSREKPEPHFRVQQSKSEITEGEQLLQVARWASEAAETRRAPTRWLVVAMLAMTANFAAALLSETILRSGLVSPAAEFLAEAERALLSLMDR